MHPFIKIMQRDFPHQYIINDYYIGMKEGRYPNLETFNNTSWVIKPPARVFGFKTQEELEAFIRLSWVK